MRRVDNRASAHTGVEYIANTRSIDLSARSDGASHFQITTKCIGEFDLTRRPALHLEQRRAGDDHSHASGTRNRNVQAVQAVQEFHCTLARPRGWMWPLSKRQEGLPALGICPRFPLLPLLGVFLTAPKPARCKERQLGSSRRATGPSCSTTERNFRKWLLN